MAKTKAVKTEEVTSTKVVYEDGDGSTGDGTTKAALEHGKDGTTKAVFEEGEPRAQDEK